MLYKGPPKSISHFSKEEQEEFYREPHYVGDDGTGQMVIAPYRAIFQAEKQDAISK